MLGRPAVQEHRLPLLLRRLDRMVETDELAVGGDYRVTIAQCDAVTGPAVVNIAEWPDLLRKIRKSRGRSADDRTHLQKTALGRSLGGVAATAK